MDDGMASGIFQNLAENEEPDWANIKYEKPDFQAIKYYAAPKVKPELESLDEVDPELLKTFEKLGINIEEQKRLSGVAVDIVMDSVSVKTTFQDTNGKRNYFLLHF
jgi:Fe-S cluster assembly protein SufB